MRNVLLILLCNSLLLAAKISTYTGPPPTQFSADSSLLLSLDEVIKSAQTDALIDWERGTPIVYYHDSRLDTYLSPFLNIDPQTGFFPLLAFLPYNVNGYNDYLSTYNKTIDSLVQNKGYTSNDYLEWMPIIKDPRSYIKRNRDKTTRIKLNTPFQCNFPHFRINARITHNTSDSKEITSDMMNSTSADSTDYLWDQFLHLNLRYTNKKSSVMLSCRTNEAKRIYICKGPADSNLLFLYCKKWRRMAHVSCIDIKRAVVLYSEM